MNITKVTSINTFSNTNSNNKCNNKKINQAQQISFQHLRVLDYGVRQQFKHFQKENLEKVLEIIKNLENIDLKFVEDKSSSSQSSIQCLIKIPEVQTTVRIKRNVPYSEWCRMCQNIEDYIKIDSLIYADDPEHICNSPRIISNNTMYDFIDCKPIPETPIQAYNSDAERDFMKMLYFISDLNKQITTNEDLVAKICRSVVPE